MPKVKPLGTQPDGRYEKLYDTIWLGMIRKRIGTIAELSRLTGISDDKLRSRMKYPQEMKFDEMLKISDVLDLDSKDLAEVFNRKEEKR